MDKPRERPYSWWIRIAWNTKCDRKNPFRELILFFRFQYFWRTTWVTTCATLRQLDTKDELGNSRELIRTCSGKISNRKTKKYSIFRNILTILAVQKSINGYWFYLFGRLFQMLWRLLQVNYWFDLGLTLKLLTFSLICNTSCSMWIWFFVFSTICFDFNYISWPSDWFIYLGHHWWSTWAASRFDLIIIDECCFWFTIFNFK